MSDTAFDKQVKQGLKKLDRQQQVQFAWRCAVRALPFLGGDGSFDFWDKGIRQRHIYSIFYALDSAAAYLSSATRADVFAAFTDASSFAAASSSASSASASFGAASAASAAFGAAFGAAFAAARAAANSQLNLEALIFNDLQSDRADHSFNFIDFYGAIWGNFQIALEAEGCAYWGRLYKNIFVREFKLDSVALKMRMNVPTEIRAQGAATVAGYLEAAEKGATRLNEARIIILGDKGAGKTCIARRLIKPDAAMTTDEESTAGVDTQLWKLKHKSHSKKSINVRIWDFAGHTITHAVHQFFLSERCLYLMVYNGRTEEKNRLEYWLNHMQNYGGNSQAIILVNERDSHSSEINENSLKERYSIAGIYHFSIKNDADKLKYFREKVVSYISSNVSWGNQTIAKNYYQVKEALESLFTSGEAQQTQEHITQKEFNEIAEQYEVKDKNNLLQSLHYLGVILWYKDMAGFDTLVLNPEWISHGVYKIINWVHEAKEHSLTLSDFTTVFSQDSVRYPDKEHAFLFKLMMHYELAYETNQGNNLIIPHLLKEDRPKTLPDFPIGTSLLVRYKAEQPLPPNTISRFIVRHHQQISKNQPESAVWRYGVILEDSNGSLALVREEDRTISVSVKGKDQTNYLTELRTTLNDIFDSYKSEKPDLQYRIERHGKIPDESKRENQLWLPGRQIYQYANKDTLYPDYITGQDIDLKPAKENYNITINSNNVILGGQGNLIASDQSKHTTFNFHRCNIGLQGDLNELAQLLTESGEQKAAKELESVAQALEQVEQCQSQDEVKKKGIANRLRRLVDDLEDKDSKLNKSVKGLKNGVKIIQDIANKYNEISEWLAGLATSA